MIQLTAPIIFLGISDREANSVDADQTAHKVAVISGSAIFVIPSSLFGDVFLLLG